MKGLIYAIPLVAAMVGLAKAKDPSLKPAETGTELQIYEGDVPEGTDILILMYANGLLADALSDPDNIKPMELGMAAVMYFAMANSVKKPDCPASERLRAYGRSLLEQATSVAKSQKKAYTMFWLAYVWKNPYLGPGTEYAHIGDELIKEAKTLYPDKAWRTTSAGHLIPESGFMGPGKDIPSDWLLPQDYYEE